MAETYLTPADLADRLRCSEVTLARWRREGYGPAFLKPGGRSKSHVRYRESDVQAWEAASRMTNTGQAA